MYPCNNKLSKSSHKSLFYYFMIEHVLSVDLKVAEIIISSIDKYVVNGNVRWNPIVGSGQ